jgi:HD-GYP domain-containing protein (c-di-GMP phosphodiesterase class II)
LSNYVPIRLSTIRSEKALDFSVYIKLPSKYLLYLNSGDALDEERIESLKERKVKRLYIADIDEEAYLEFLDRALQEFKEDPGPAPDKKASLIAGYASNAIEEVRRDPSSEKAFERTKNAAEGILEVISRDPAVLLELFKHEDDDQEADVLLRSGVKVSTLAMKFAQSLELKKETIHEIGIAALLRDIGATKYPSVYATKTEEHSAEEEKIYRQHPNDTVKALSDREFISEKILKLIQTHEETLAGTGFPGKLTFLTQEEQILSLVSAYDRMVTIDRIHYFEALKTLKIEQVGHYNLELLEKLSKLLVVEGLI